MNYIVKELFRKSIHLCSGFIPLLLYYFYWPTIILLFLAVSGYVLCEVIRKKGGKIPIISKITELAQRERDEHKFVLGPVTLVFGILLAALFLPFEASSIGIFALAFGDGLASLVGKAFGKIKIPHMGGKTIAGCLACFIAVFFATYFTTKNVVLSLFIASFTMIIEVLPLFDFDNLIIPLCVGSIYFLLVQFGL